MGAKDAEGARIFYEPLAAWDPNGNVVPVLAAQIPDIENGGVAADGMSVTWRLKTGVQWHDSQPFSADDVVFNWEYASDPATAATTIGSYQDMEIAKIDSFNGAGSLRETDAVLGKSRQRSDYPQTPVRAL